MYDCFDEETLALVKKGINPISFPGLSLSITSDESKMINFDDEPKVILSASGMCEAGAYPSSFEAQSVATGKHSSVRGLSGSRHTGPFSGGGRERSEAFWRAGGS